MTLQSIHKINTFWQYLLLLIVVAGYFSLTQHHLFHELQNDVSVPQVDHIEFGLNTTPNEKPADDSNVNESCVHCLLSHFTVADIPVYKVPIIDDTSYVVKFNVAERKFSYPSLLYNSRAPPTLV